MNKLVIGSRGSRLALIQANHVKDILLETHPKSDIQIEVIRTKGDINPEQPLHEMGSKNVFTSEIEKALLQRKIDLAVHSLKDLPSTLHDGLMYIGSPKREDARDVFVSSKWEVISEVPKGGVVATGSIRRKAQLLHLRPDIDVVGLRGNIDTRLSKLDEYNWDGIIIAAAALHRLGLEDRISQYLDPKYFLPAGGQGALGLEIVAGNNKLESMMMNIIDAEATCCCKAERAYLRRIDADCFSPIGCFASIDVDKIFISAYSSSLDGKENISKTISGDIKDAEKLALQLADEMLQSGAKELTSN